jgi:hypothetical protein
VYPFHMSYMPTAYLLAFIDTTTTPPQVVSAGIFSENAGSITTDLRREFAVDVFETKAGSYSDARRSLQRAVKSSPALTWLVPLMRKGELDD